MECAGLAQDGNRLRSTHSGVILHLMSNWVALSEDERSDIKTKLITALGSIGIKSAIGRWNKPGELRCWQLTIGTLWCSTQSRHGIARALEQAIARADIDVPRGGVILRGP